MQGGVSCKVLYPTPPLLQPSSTYPPREVQHESGGPTFGLSNALKLVSVTWSRAHEAAREVRSGQTLLQDGDDLLVKVLHGHGGDVAQLLQDLVGPLGRARRVHVAQHAVDLIDHLQEMFRGVLGDRNHPIQGWLGGQYESTGQTW